MNEIRGGLMQKRKLASVLLILVLCICFSPVANAVCDYETQVQLATEASNVNTNYEISEVVVDMSTGQEVTGLSDEEIDNDDNSYIRQDKVTIYIYNLTENLKVSISGDNDYEDVFTYQESDNGTITIEGGNLENVINYTIEILSANPSCVDDELRTINLTTPKENDYYYYSACDGVNEYYCQQFIDYDLNMTEAEILERANNARNNTGTEEEVPEEEKNWWDNLRKYLDNHPWVIYVTIGVVVVIAGVATAVIVIKKRRSKVL